MVSSERIIRIGKSAGIILIILGIVILIFSLIRVCPPDCENTWIFPCVSITVLIIGILVLLYYRTK